MEKLIIVDDEDLTRFGLSKTIDWNALGFEIVGMAENGAQGLEMARRLKPDLIISDVRMPVMDGLEMAKTLFEENADLAIIVYSGYKDFEYAHRAIHSGIAGFLLKPIENDELIRWVKDVMRKLHKKRQENRMLGQFRENVPILRKRLLDGVFRARSEEDVLRAKEQLAMLDLRLPASGSFVYCAAERDLDPVTQALEKELSDFETVTEIYKDYSVAVTSASDIELVRSAVAKVLDNAVKITDTRYKVGIARLQNDHAGAFKEAERLSKNILFSAINAVAVEGEESGAVKQLIRNALSIIESDYDKRLSIKTVAAKLFTSESYLMHEFKAETGETFNECLTEFRIFKAQELFLKGNLRVKEVAYAVGYTDVKYFGQVFKERTGMTPSEYILIKTYESAQDND